MTLATIGLLPLVIVIAASPQLDSSARHVAVAWTADLSRGDAAAACRLQAEEQVGGRRCSSLHTIVHHCPVRRSGVKRVAARIPNEQVGSVQVHGNLATAPVIAQRRSSHYRALLTLSKGGGRWRIESLRRRGHIFSPAGLVAGSVVAGHLWLACVRPIFRERRGGVSNR